MELNVTRHPGLLVRTFEPECRMARNTRNAGFSIIISLRSPGSPLRGADGDDFSLSSTKVSYISTAALPMLSLMHFMTYDAFHRLSLK